MAGPTESEPDWVLWAARKIPEGLLEATSKPHTLKEHGSAAAGCWPDTSITI